MYTHGRAVESLDPQVNGTSEEVTSPNRKSLKKSDSGSDSKFESKYAGL